MRRPWIALSLLFGYLLLAHTPVFAQDDATEAAKLSAQRDLEAKQTMEAQQKSQKALADFLRSYRSPTGGLNGMNYQFLQFRMAIPKFRAATDEYRWVLSMRGKLDKPVKEIGSQADIMLKYLSAGKVNHPKQDPREFKDFSAAELQWEMLNSAERIGAFLDFAVLAERQEVVTPKTLEFLYTLNGELLRLKWLTSHIK